MVKNCNHKTQRGFKGNLHVKDLIGFRRSLINSLNPTTDPGSPGSIRRFHAGKTGRVPHLQQPDPRQSCSGEYAKLTARYPGSGAAQFPSFVQARFPCQSPNSAASISSRSLVNSSRSIFTVSVSLSRPVMIRLSR